MKNYEYIFWDFDGTLVDTRIGTRESAWYALQHFNKNIEKNAHLENIFCGPPLKDSFKKFGLNEQEINEAIKLYRKYQRENTIELSELFDGVKEMLEILKLQNKKLIIVTAKVEPTVIKILEYLQVYKYFDLVVGATEDLLRTKKDEILSYAISCFKNIDISKCIMIGDRASDIKAGIKQQMDTIGVLYGMDNRDVLQEAGATYLAENTNQIIGILDNEIIDKELVEKNCKICDNFLQKNNLEFKYDKEINKQQLVNLFDSVGWKTAEYPNRLYTAIKNSEYVIQFGMKLN